MRRLFGNRWVRTLPGRAGAVPSWSGSAAPLLGIGAAHPFDTEFVRIAGDRGLFVFWLVYNLLRELRASRREKELAAGSPRAASGGGEGARARQRRGGRRASPTACKEAMATLKKSKLGGSKKRLAMLPWYMFIGPPGAGKTTALVNSGLKFPLADKEGPTRAARRRRHAQLRLVVHRRGGADRHRRPLHDAGQRRPTSTRPAGSASCSCSRSTAGGSRSTA